MVLSRPQKMSAMVPARIMERRSTTRPFSMNGIFHTSSPSCHLHLGLLRKDVAR